MSRTAGSPTTGGGSLAPKGHQATKVSPPDAQTIVVLCGQMTLGRGDRKRWFRRACILGVFLIGAFSVLVDQSDAKPCQNHVGPAKAACVKQAKRDAMPFPPAPSWADAVRRISAYDLATAERVSACEEPGSEHGTGRGASPWGRRWSLNGGTYVSGFGMAASSYRWAASYTGYPTPPEATPAMQLLTAVKGAHLWGWSGWGCF